MQNVLADGVSIIAEDYLGTGIAWGVGAGFDKEFLIFMNSHLVQPDLSFCFYGKRFKTGIEKNHKHESDNALTDKVQEIHLELANQFGWIKINANRNIDEIYQQIWQVFMKKFNEFKNNGG